MDTPNFDHPTARRRVVAAFLVEVNQTYMQEVVICVDGRQRRPVRRGDGRRRVTAPTLTGTQAGPGGDDARARNHHSNDDRP